VKRLIVTADDFGAAREVNEAVEAAHRGGILTAASLMVAARAADDAVARARRMPSLRVGLHVVLVEGKPVLPASDVPHLVDGSGDFRSDMAALGTVIAVRAGMFNIGQAGQLTMGATLGAAIALNVPGPGPLVLVLSLLGAAAGGAIWAGIAAVLRFKWNISASSRRCS